MFFTIHYKIRHSTVENAIYSRRNVFNRYNGAFLSIYKENMCSRKKKQPNIEESIDEKTILHLKLDFQVMNGANYGCKI